MSYRLGGRDTSAVVRRPSRGSQRRRIGSRPHLPRCHCRRAVATPWFRERGTCRRRGRCQRGARKCACTPGRQRQSRRVFLGRRGAERV